MRWERLRVGQIIKIKDGEMMPADIILINSSETENGSCLLETQNLQGENDLVRKESDKLLRSLVSE